MTKRGSITNKPPTTETLKGRALAHIDRAKAEAARNRVQGQTEPRGEQS